MADKVWLGRDISLVHSFLLVNFYAAVAQLVIIFFFTVPPPPPPCILDYLLYFLSITRSIESRSSSMVRALDSWLKGCGFKSLQEWRDSFLLQGQLSVPTLILVSVPPPCYRNSTYKILVILPKVQVTAKHACILRMWLCMKWHGAWLYGVHRMHRDGSNFLWHQPCQCCKYKLQMENRVT